MSLERHVSSILHPNQVCVLSKLFDWYLHTHSVFLNRMDGLKDLFSIQKSVFNADKQRKEISKVPISDS